MVKLENGDWKVPLKRKITPSQSEEDFTMKRLSWPEYKAIQNYYQNKSAARSKVPLINHIDEGLAIMRYMAFSDMCQRAFCLHPLLQSDEALLENYQKLPDDISPQAVLLGMEYRRVANSCLSYMGTKSSEKGAEKHFIFPTPVETKFPEVLHMLLADKIQNRKDFLLYSQGKITGSERLTAYFEYWLTAYFNLSSEQITTLTDVISREEVELEEGWE